MAKNRCPRNNEEPQTRGSYQEPEADDAEGDDPIGIVSGDVQSQTGVQPKPQSHSHCDQHARSHEMPHLEHPFLPRCQNVDFILSLGKWELDNQ